MVARSKKKQQLQLAWQPVAIAVLTAVLVVLLLILTLCTGPRDEVDHVAAGDYIHAVEPDGAVIESREVTGGPGEPVHDVNGTATRATMRILDEGRTSEGVIGTTSVISFGDVVVGNTMIGLADGWQGEAGDGTYGFAPLFSNIGQLISAYDIATVGEVGVLGGFEGKGFAGWPLYNTPDELASSLADAGFRVVNTNTGHLLDWGQDSAAHARGLWQEQESLLAVGSYEDEVDEEIVRVVECNGVRIAFLSYSTQQAATTVEEGTPSYVAPLVTEEAIRTGVANAYTVADAVVVFMHWGDDASHLLNDQQKSLAKICAEAGASAVIGTGSRTLQAVEWVSAANDKRCLVAYGLGALASCYSTPDEILSAALSFEVKLLDDGSTEIGNVVMHPLVEHRIESNDTVYLLRNYSSELAGSNNLLADAVNPYEKLTEIVSTQLGIDVKTDL